jgi:hypothetical protein
MLQDPSIQTSSTFDLLAALAQLVWEEEGAARADPHARGGGWRRWLFHIAWRGSGCPDTRRRRGGQNAE